MEFFNNLGRYQNHALGLLRIMTGLLFMQGGTQKLFNFPSAYPFKLSTQLTIGGGLELVGGLLIVLGLFTRPVAFILSGMMAVAYFQFHFMMKGFYPIINGGGLAALFCFVLLYLATSGPGAWAMDKR